jgi:hypothetical protein
MPLSAPVEREHLHTRTVTVYGYRRADGLYDLEGHLTDIPTGPFVHDELGPQPAGTPVHNMWLRLTIDRELTVHDAEAKMDDWPHALCPHVEPNFKRLVGLKIGSGWRREIKRRLGGVEGCTHLVELLQPIATTAFQTLYEDRREAAKPADPAKPKEKPFEIDGCYSWASDGPNVKQHYPEFYTGDA